MHDLAARSSRSVGIYDVEASDREVHQRTEALLEQDTNVRSGSSNEFTYLQGAAEVGDVLYVEVRETTRISM